MPGECAPRAVARTPTTDHRRARLLSRAAAPLTSSVIGGGDLLRLLLSRPRRPRRSLTEREREREWGLNLDMSVGPLMGAACSPCCPRRRTPRHRYSVSRLLDLPDLLHANSVTSDKRFETILEVASERATLPKTAATRGDHRPLPPGLPILTSPAAPRPRERGRSHAVERRGGGAWWGCDGCRTHHPAPIFVSLFLSLGTTIRPTAGCDTPNNSPRPRPQWMMVRASVLAPLSCGVVRCRAVSPRVARVAHVRCCCTSCCTRRA